MVAPTPGTVVSVSLSLYEHYGVVSDRSDNHGPWIISNSKSVGMIVEEPLHQFSEGKDIRMHGYPCSLPPSDIVDRARSVLGCQYSLFHSNCEHFVRWAHGLKPKSPQLKAALAISGIASLSVIGWGRFMTESPRVKKALVFGGIAGLVATGLALYEESA